MKKVYVLGAGFPAQADLPILNNFFTKVREKKDKTDTYNNGESIEKDAFERVLRLFDGVNDKDGNPYNMESAFSAICGEPFDIKNFDSIFTNREQLKKDFLYTVCRTFHLCWTDGGKEKSKQLYSRFLEVVIKEQAALITFNYDLILDNLFFGMCLLPYYGFELNKENTINYSNLPGLKESGVTFLKMHGSQQWFKCNSCQKEFGKIDLKDSWPSNRGKNKDFSSGENCIICSKKTMDYLITPPLINKEEPDEEFLKAVWGIAKCKIQGAEEIVFIGYSFPDSDKNIRNRFGSWIEINGILKSVIVVDPNANQPGFIERFNEVFKSKGITYISKTFLCWFLEDVLKAV